jgi:hypothetical protein
MKKLTDSKISLIEKIIVNWATPVEGLALMPDYLLSKAGFDNKFSFQKDINRYGLFMGMWESKIRDYKRLVQYSCQNENIPKKVLKLYDGTPCGAVMKLTYKVFREK